MKLLYASLLIFIVWSCGREKPVPSENVATDNTEQLFTLLDSAATGVDFVNEVVDGERFNILTYRNFYNGGGVAIGDINNDSLPDLYFTANQKKNKLYLNKGNFVFEDITERAGVGGTKAWSTGVTMTDVNSDGLLDIYVCNSGDVDGALRENELFINNGDLTFSERSREYNLDNSGYSTHAAFFDYDLDGDLDCYILNNSFMDPAKIELYKKMREQPSPGGDRLMRNDGGTFHDVTKEAGIYSSEIGFGLGVAVGDVNHDHLPDIYISNDFWERDYLYINKGNGKFSEELIERVDYCSVSSMGADIADLNSDGSPEIFTTDMLPADNDRLKTTMAFDPYHLEDLKYRANYHYQMIQNCLHLNDGNGYFQEVALMANVAATDWSWGALIFDFENDGQQDIFVSNGILKDIMSMDFREFIANRENGSDVISKEQRDDRSFISHIPSKPLKNYAFRQEGALIFHDRADALGLGKPSFSNGSAYGDLDNDGDLDLVINNINSASFVYRNDTGNEQKHHYLKVRFNGSKGNPFGIGASVTITTKNGKRVLENFTNRGFESSVEPCLLFGLGENTGIDEVKVTWPDRKVQVLSNIKADRTIVLTYEDASAVSDPKIKELAPAFEEISAQVIPGDARHHENRHNDFDQEILLPRMLSTEGPRLITGNVNHDALNDLVLLGAAGDPDKLFVQRADGTFLFKPTAAFVKDKSCESTCGALTDYDGDGDADLMISSGGNELEMDRANFRLRLYKNDGRGNFQADMDHAPPLVGNFSTLEVEDIDKDGDVDIFLGARTVPGNYGLPCRSFLLMNENGTWVDAAPPSLGNIGMVTDASWSDVDTDGDPDLVVVGDWMAITVFKNDRGTLSDAIPIPNSSGWWNRIEPADLDADGDIDFVVGNWGLNTKFKASPEKPVTMFVNDFDDNGKSEFIINWYPPLDTLAYPFATKPELTFQIPSLRKTILKYADYGPKTYETLFSQSVRQRSLSYKADYLGSAILWNEGGKLTLTALPREAQVSPVFAIAIDDFDSDGKIDLWLGGNFYALKPQAGRHDASKGVLLKGSPNRSFIPQPLQHNGLYVKGEVRDAVVIAAKDHSKRLFIARNNNKVLVFKTRK